MRVTIESWALQDPRLFMLMAELGITRREALGLLIDIWHGTQELLIIHSHHRMLLALCRPDGAPYSAKQAFDALLASGYVVRTGDDVYLIKGNDKPVAKLAAARASAEARWKPMRTQCERNANAMRTQCDGNAYPAPVIEDKYAMSSETTDDEKPGLPKKTAAQELLKKEAGLAQANPDSVAVDKSPTRGPRDLVEVWNAECRGGMVHVKEIKPGTVRWNSAKARLQDEPDLEVHRKWIRDLAALAWVRGEAPAQDGRKPWRGNFDWFIKPATRTKIIEGFYGSSNAEPPKKFFKTVKDLYADE